MPLVLSNEDVEKVLDIRQCMEVLEHSFKDYANGKAVNRPRSHTYTPIDQESFYLFKSMDGAVPRYGVHALRLTSEVIREYRSGETMRSEKIASMPDGKWLGLILLFSTMNGEILAIIKDGYLQRMRVGATSGLAAHVDTLKREPETIRRTMRAHARASGIINEDREKTSRCIMQRWGVTREVAESCWKTMRGRFMAEMNPNLLLPEIEYYKRHIEEHGTKVEAPDPKTLVDRSFCNFQ